MTTSENVRDWKPIPYGDYKWIVRDPDLLGGKLAVRSTRLSVSFVLACLAEGMSVNEIAQTYGAFPHEAIPEIMRVASELIESADGRLTREFSELQGYWSRIAKERGVLTESDLERLLKR
jgi:uncharacterized protein (DUF433 family)